MGVEMDKQLIEQLRAQAEEIAAAGHAGWGNTMRDAADALARIDAERGEEAVGFLSVDGYWPAGAGVHGTPVFLSPTISEGMAQDAERFIFLQNLAPEKAQAFFWNYASRKQRAKAIDEAMLAAAKGERNA